MKEMQDNEMRALLGPAYDTTTDDDRERIARAAAQIAARWPGDDERDTREQIASGAMQAIIGDTTDAQIAAEALEARMAWLDAQARLTGAIIAGAIIDPAEGDQPRATRLGVARDTVRKALGR